DEFRGSGAYWHRVTFGGDEVFDSNRHPVELTCGTALAPSRLGRCCLSEGALSIDDIHRIELWFPGLYTRQHGAGHLDRRELFHSVGVRQIKCGEVVELACHLVSLEV